MARNVEIKAKVDDLSALLQRVRRITKTDPTIMSQDDTFFSCDNGRLKLRTLSKDHGELIFYRRDNQGGPKECFYLRSSTSQPENLCESLKLAYGSIGRVIKTRSLFLVGRTRIHLDQVQGLGDYLELEVVLAENDTIVEAIEEAQQLMLELGVKQSHLISGAYLDLLHQEQP